MTSYFNSTSVRSENSSATKTSGFTLVELIVVIAIIGLLASVTMAALGSSRRKAEIAQVRQNYQAVIKSLELYHQANGMYPLQGIADTDENGIDLDGIASVEFVVNNYLQEYLTEAPAMPVTVGSDAYYRLNPDKDGLTYSCEDSTGTEPYIIYFTAVSDDLSGEGDFPLMYEAGNSTPIENRRCLAMTSK